jgi:hypothetical protein
MRSAAIVAALCALLNVSLAQIKPTPSLQPTRLEAFAAQPTAQVTWSTEVGQIESSEARAIVTALVITDAAQPPHRMCGIRIDLANQRAKDQVYLGEAKPQAVKRALEEIEGEIATFRKEPADSPYRYHGAAEFWHPQLKVHTLNAAYYIAPDSTGLSLSAYKGQEFRFPNHRPLELARLIDTATAELEQHCETLVVQEEERSLSDCSQAAATQDALIREAEKERFILRRLELIGNVNTPDELLHQRIASRMPLGEPFRRDNLISSLKSLSRLKMLYPVRMKDVVARLDRAEKTLVLRICFKEKALSPRPVNSIGVAVISPS